MSAAGKAMVMTGANKPFEPREYPLPEIVPGSLLVRVLCCTICRSDLHTYSGKRSGPVPLILGHEIVGRIVEMGSGVTIDAAGRTLAVGDRITWTISSNCGRCYYCRVAGLPMKCVELFKYGHDSCARPPHFVGGFAEYCFIRPGTAVVKLPDTLSDTVAAPANCALATVTACWDAAGLQHGETVLIQGAGGLGCYAAAVARYAGCRRVIVADVDEKRLQFARLFGATDTIAVSAGSGGTDTKAVTGSSGDTDTTTVTGEDEFVRQVQSLTEGRGADVGLEVTGVPEAVPLGLKALRKGGRYIEAGCSFPNAVVELDLSVVLWNRLSLVGVHNYDACHLKNAVDFLAAARERYPFEKMVTSIYPLDELDKAMRAAASGEEMRVAVVPNKE